MRTMLITCFAGICFLSTLFFKFRQENIFPPISNTYAQKVAQYERNASAFDTHLSLGNILDAPAEAATETESISVSAEPIASVEKKSVVTITTKESVQKEMNELPLEAEEISTTSLIEEIKEISIKELEPVQISAKIEQPLLKTEEITVKMTAPEEIAYENAQADEANKKALALAANQVQTNASEEAEEKAEANTNSVATASAKSPTHIKNSKEDHSYSMLMGRMLQLQKYAQANHFSNKYALIADLGLEAARQRFYLVDLSTMLIVKSGMVAFDKKPGSFSSVYRIENSGNRSYELYSLDKKGVVNSQAPLYLKSLECVPLSEIETLTCKSEGGPGLSPRFMDEIRPVLEEKGKPVLLWMFE